MDLTTNWKLQLVSRGTNFVNNGERSEETKCKLVGGSCGQGCLNIRLCLEINFITQLEYSVGAFLISLRFHFVLSSN
jgi:hypothetical protein